MASEISSQFYSALNLPVYDRLSELTRLIDQATPLKDLHALFPQLVNSIFGCNAANSWCLRAITFEEHNYEFEILHNFLSPQGPLFRLCYKLLADPGLKYPFPLHLLPFELQQLLERGRCPQFYGDMLTMDSSNVQVTSLSLNPFDYYIFQFAVHLLNNRSVNSTTWENWNTVYFALVCDYLTHFLPADPNVIVLPNIPNYSGKSQVISQLQNVNRPSRTPSLLIVQDLMGMPMQQHSPSQLQSSNNEVWRSETILQAFVDIWMSVDSASTSSFEVNAFNSGSLLPPMASSSRVRVVRVLVKQVHAFASTSSVDPASRSSALRRHALHILSMKGFRYVKHLVTTWPLDASFRLVLELWLSLIQPWRYAGTDSVRFQKRQTNEDNSPKQVDGTYMQFISENILLFTAIFQQVVLRLMHLDLSVPINAIMLFRIAKVFSQPNLTRMILDVESALMKPADVGRNSSGTGSVSYSSFHSSPEGSPIRWGAIARQAIAELSPAGFLCYQPIWSEKAREDILALLRKAARDKMSAEEAIARMEEQYKREHQGFYSMLKSWFWDAEQGDISLIDRKKVPLYLSFSVMHLSQIFEIEDSSFIVSEATFEEGHTERSSFANSHRIPSPTAQLRNKSSHISYMGDPDLMPISTTESTILVRILYQIATRINEVCRDDFCDFWRRRDFVGYVAREVLCKPCTVHSYAKGGPTYNTLVSRTLPPRISLRKLGSYTFVSWLTFGYILSRFFGYGAFFYISFIIFSWLLVIVTKAAFKYFGIVSEVTDIVV